jgi:hypothetical protein
VGRLRPPAAAAALALVWATETFLVQEHTLAATHHQEVWAAVGYRLARAGLDLSACAAAVAFVPRGGLTAYFLVEPALHLAVSVYRDFFRQPLSLQLVLHNHGEGAAVADAVLPLLQLWHGLFLVALALKLWLLWGSDAGFAASTRRRVGAALASTWIVLFGALNWRVMPLWKLKTWGSVGGLGALYGYVPTWLTELTVLGDDGLRLRAQARAATLPPEADRLATREAAFPRRPRLVFLQLESFDCALLDFRIDGREVTPHVNRLWRSGLHWTVLAPKGTGSSDADFRALMGREPSADVPTYKIAGYPWDAALPRLLRDAGWTTTAVHGVTGEFFGRRSAYEQMGFAELVFREEFVRDALAPVTGWTVDDDALLRWTAGHVTQTSTAGKLPQFTLAITATSHIPYPVPSADREFFPDRTAAEWAYFDSVHWVDAAVGRFVAALPPETTVVLYGDHISRVENPELGYTQVLRGEDGCTPFAVVDTSEALASRQLTKDLATTCDVSLLEAVRYVHAVVLGSPSP